MEDMMGNNNTMQRNFLKHIQHIQQIAALTQKYDMGEDLLDSKLFSKKMNLDYLVSFGMELFGMHHKKFKLEITMKDWTIKMIMLLFHRISPQLSA